MRQTQMEMRRLLQWVGMNRQHIIRPVKHLTHILTKQSSHYVVTTFAEQTMSTWLQVWLYHCTFGSHRSRRCLLLWRDGAINSPGTKQSSGRGRREGPCQAAGSAKCGASSPCRIELDILIQLANRQKFGEEKIINVIEDVPKHETRPEYHGRPL